MTPPDEENRERPKLQPRALIDIVAVQFSTRADDSDRIVRRAVTSGNQGDTNGQTTATGGGHGCTAEITSREGDSAANTSEAKGFNGQASA